MLTQEPSSVFAAYRKYENKQPSEIHALIRDGPLFIIATLVAWNCVQDQEDVALGTQLLRSKLSKLFLEKEIGELIIRVLRPFAGLENISVAEISTIIDANMFRYEHVPARPMKKGGGLGEQVQQADWQKKKNGKYGNNEKGGKHGKGNGNDGHRQHPYKNYSQENGKAVCKFFLSANGCKKGDSCNMKHERPTSSSNQSDIVLQQQSSSQESTNATNQNSNSGDTVDSGKKGKKGGKGGS